MNKAELKKFAVEARRDLIDKVSLRAEQYGISQDHQEVNIEENFGQLIVNGKTFPTEIKHAVHTLQQRLNQVGYDQLIEEVAYTWFNRIIAIRYMEVNNYLPDRVNVLSSSTGKNEPDILLQYETMNLNVNHQQINHWIQKNDNEYAYRKLFVAQCNSLNKALPKLFERINDYTELLLPDYLLDSDFVISKLVNNLELIDSFVEVEVIGWLYQYYNSEPKDEVFAKLRRNSKVEKNDIPYATQIFTPKWIVKYLVENSIGKIWIENNPNTNMKDSMRYYIETGEHLTKIREQSVGTKYINPEELTVIDPCVGSGHILTYAFDLLYKFYEETGYIKSDIPKLILENNLYGLDIDERAIQMTYFSLMMKGREKSRSILKQSINLNVYTIEESNGMNTESFKKLLAKNKQDENEIEAIINFYQDGKNFGSILVPPNYNYDKFINRIENMEPNQISLETIEAYDEINKFNNILRQTQLLYSQYDVAITNPPYMGIKGMNKKLKKFVQKYYSDSKSDFYSIFIQRLQTFTKEHGINSSITQHSWMFIGSFEKLRENILSNQTLLNLVHLGTRAFDDIGGEVVQTSAQTFRKIIEPNYRSTFIRLVDYNNSENKKAHFKDASNIYYINQSSFQHIPSKPIAYWASDKVIDIFKNNIQIKDVASVKKGSFTGDNNRFLKLWHEVNFEKVALNLSDREASKKSEKKWFPYNKGGSFRKWYGNQEYLVNWFNDGQELKNFVDSKGKLRSGIRNPHFYFQEGITWSDVATGDISFRFIPQGFINDATGPTMFLKDYNETYMLLAYANSKVLNELSKFTMSTLHFNNGTMAVQPYKRNYDQKINDLVLENINLSMWDWDSFETSWNFKTNPLVFEGNLKLEDSFKKRMTETYSRFETVKKNEELINSYFIDLFKLGEEISPEVKNNEVTIYQADKKVEVKNILSYFIGCLMGRYSLDVEGLTYAGGEFDDSNYGIFKPNPEGLIQLSDKHYFDNDIVVRIREFLSATFSPDTVDENMQWLAETLTMKKNESPEERLRRYFLDEFFKDHCKTYQKRPIYWLVDSGKQKGLRTLIYMHRYQPDTMATIRFDHLQEIQSKYQNEINMIDTRLANPSLSATDRRSLEKAKTDYQKKIDELQEFDKHLATYANEQIDIDLDDGVKVNYAKFDKVLAKIK